MSELNQKPVSICLLVKDGSKEGSVIKAQFNPQELSFQKAVSWTGGSEGVGMDYPSLMFTSGQAVTMSLELLFDYYEPDPLEKREGPADVRPIVSELINLCMIDDDLHRPPKVQLCWDGKKDVLGIGKEFCGVIENATAKYTMFLSSGIPVRASVSVSIRQADDLGYQTVVRDENGDKFTEQKRRISNPAELTQIDGAKEAAIREGKDPNDPKQYPMEITIKKVDLQKESKE